MRSAGAKGRAVGVRWGLAVLLGTARGCWGLPGMPGMRSVIEFAGDCWGQLVIAQTPVSPPLKGLGHLVMVTAASIRAA